MGKPSIRVVGARQNNLKNLNVDFPYRQMTVITGVSGCGKSSLAFDTLYAEGQRRYVETFSPYARQFLDRMDKPAVKHIHGMLPAIAIDQLNPVKTSRSTVGTMTELNDFIKLLFARAANVYCSQCAQPVVEDNPASVVKQAYDKANKQEVRALYVAFTIAVPENFSLQEIETMLARQGYVKLLERNPNQLVVQQDRMRVTPQNRPRLQEAVEAAIKLGNGHMAIYPEDKNKQIGQPWRYSTGLHCPQCNIAFQSAGPNHFSFNSPVGACETCRGFGRVIGFDEKLVIPDTRKTLDGGAIRPWQSDSYRECQADMLRFARQRNIPTDVSWQKLNNKHRRWVLEGEGEWDDGLWYGVKRFFRWLEGRSYKMHIRVLLSKYRSYSLCPDCQGARLKPASLLWRIGDQVHRGACFMPTQTAWHAKSYHQLPGLNFHELMLLSIKDCDAFFRALRLPTSLGDAAKIVLTEIRSRLNYLLEVGLDYLSLDRQSRTLSGGEVQRINLTTALGTSLINTLFVLDEPSIGLHPRDIKRMIGVLHRLRDAGNTLVVVEHDADMILAADRVLDLGPGPGQDGGRKVFHGSAKALLSRRTSLTGQYLRGEKRIGMHGPTAHSIAQEHPCIEVRGAAQHNLKNINVRFPLQTMTAVTGVSGAGKSTLIHDILYLGLMQIKQQPKDTPGIHQAIIGADQISNVIMVDQSPIGKTTRSNPASYVGAFQAIRHAFANDAEAGLRGYNAGTFSCNAGQGRCATCNGNGYEHIEMQFLSDVYIRCPDCDGKRFRAEVLDIKIYGFSGKRLSGKSIADVLDMTVSEALMFFRDDAPICRSLQPLQEVGLSYLKLGQPVPTLSGGEAQRLKLAAHLAKQPKNQPDKGALFIFDEPTTGLHFHDVAVLNRALRRLLSRGHSVLIVEHHIDLISACDWVIDLGPEGGDLGGQLVACASPEQLANIRGSHTGKALAAFFKNRKPTHIQAKKNHTTIKRGIDIVHAREHNLKNISLTIPRDKFVVISGVSGSGKSTIAFDILFNEGQRRYLESLNAYARQFVQPAAKPDIDALYGIPPTVAVEQRTSRGGMKSTVATSTEIYHFLRLLFVRVGVQYCPVCQQAIRTQSQASILAQIMSRFRGKSVVVLAPLVVARKGFYTDLAKWAAGKGVTYLMVDGAPLATDLWPRLDRYREHDIDMPVAEITINPGREKLLDQTLTQALSIGKGRVKVHSQSGRTKARLYSISRSCPGCRRSFDELDPRLFSYNSKHGWCGACLGTGTLLSADQKQSLLESHFDEPRDTETRLCPNCLGHRLNPEALAVRFKNKSIADYTVLPVSKALAIFTSMKLSARETAIARDIFKQLCERLSFLQHVGLDYLQLNRAALSLSGGEAQRIRLAAQLGSNLSGACYILDEPSIGLHPRDNSKLIKTLKNLQRQNNTVIVVEHDSDTILAADHVIDLGPGAGKLGGRLVYQGGVKGLLRSKSLTGRYLAKPPRHALLPAKPAARQILRIRAAHLHNLKNIRVDLPLNRLVVVSGVSGSGKSTLVRRIIKENLQSLLNRRGKSHAKPQWCQSFEGWDGIDRVLEVDQTPIGKTPRSCPATYVGFWNPIRKLFAETAEARLRGYQANRFSFNVKGGRCDHCDGQGEIKIAMHFLPDVKVPCEYCGGKRFNEQTLGIVYKEKTIAEILAMSVREALEFFRAHRQISHALKLLQAVGLDYLSLGQPSPTLSGGEAQRIKLVTELAKSNPTKRMGAIAPHCLYLLDEPTIGLHGADVAKLIHVMHELVDHGHSVVIIEHHLDIIAEADWIIDMGPEGGDKGGRVVAKGRPGQLAKHPSSHTARYLRRQLRQRPGQ